MSGAPEIGTLPDYPVWDGEVVLEPAEPEKAYVWDEEEQEWALVFPYLNKFGQEVNDPVPLEPPIGYVDQPDIWVTIEKMVNSRLLAREAEAAGMETLEESDDFEIDDDPDPFSIYENDGDPSIREMVKAGKEELAKMEKKTPPVTASGDKEPVRQDPQPEKTASSEDQSEAE